MRHLVITIGCEYGAKGNAIGRKIAEDLNIKFYNRELVDEIIEEVGIPKHGKLCDHRTFSGLYSQRFR